jgi:hypothetical protein
LGVRAEHPQTLIDSIQYSCDYRGLFTTSTIFNRKASRGRECIVLYVSRRRIAPVQQVLRSGNQWLVAVKRIRLPLIQSIEPVRRFQTFAKFGALAGMEFQKY